MKPEKLSISVPAPLVRFLERYQRDHSLRTKSSVVARALEALQERELESAYAEAAEDGVAATDADVWDGTAGDGITDEVWP